MNASIRSELRSIVATRSLVLLLAIGYVIVAAGSGIYAFTTKTADLPRHLEDFAVFKLGATNVGLLFMIVGVRAYTDETNHHTLARTIILTPSRPILLGAKAIVAAFVGVCFCLAAQVTVAATVSLAIQTRGLHVEADLGALLSLIGRNQLSICTLAALGVAVGVIVRNRAGALVGVVSWLAIVEPAMHQAWPRFAKVLPGQAAAGLISTSEHSDLLSPAPSGAVLFLILAATSAIALISIRRDVG